jgi:hypothetical protein
MALATLQWYGPGLKRVIDGEIDFNGHTFKAVLIDSSYTPNRDTDDDLSDVIGNEATGTGWTTGGETLTVTTGINAAGDYVYVNIADINKTGVTLSDGKHLVVFDDTHASDALVFLMTFDTALAPVAGDLDIDFPASNGSGRISY